MIQAYVNEGHLTQAEAKNLKSDEERNLNSPTLRELFLNGHLTYEQLYHLPYIEAVELERAEVRQRFTSGELCLSAVHYPLMQEYINDKHLSVAEAGCLPFYEKENLNTRVLRELFLKGCLNFQQVCKLSLFHREALKNKNIRQRFINGELCLGAVSYPLIQEYINENYLTPAEAEKLEYDKEMNLSSPVLRGLFLSKRLAFQQLFNLTGGQRSELEVEESRQRFIRGEVDLSLVEFPLIQTYVNERHLTLHAAQNLNVLERRNLTSPVLRQLFLSKHLNFQQLRSLSFDQEIALTHRAEIRQRFIKGEIYFSAVDRPLMQAYFNENYLTPAEAENVEYEKKENLNSPVLRELFLSKHLKFQQLFNLTGDQRRALEVEESRQRLIRGELDLSLVAFPLIQTYVNEKHLTLYAAQNLNYQERRNLNSSVLRELFQSKYLTFRQLCNLTWKQEVALEDNKTGIRQRFMRRELNLALVATPLIQSYVNEEKLTLQEALNLNDNEKENFNSAYLRELHIDNLLNLQRLRNITSGQRYALAHKEIRQRLLQGVLTITDVIGEQPAENKLLINETQSTHTQSVHKTISESALKLLNLYEEKENSNLGVTIDKIKSWCAKLSDKTLQNKAAKQCIQRITQIGYTFTDAKSQVSTRQLLALAWHAMHDDSKRIGTLEDVLKLFVSGLYEIQRGYNLNDLGIELDTKSNDRHICMPGTFNKIMEKLVGIHPDVNVIFITKKTASLKFPIIVKEEAQQFLAQYANPQNEKARLALVNLLNKIDKEGVSAIWEDIVAKVKQKMFAEFQDLFNGIEDPAFVGFVDGGQYADIGDISHFRLQTLPALVGSTPPNTNAQTNAQSGAVVTTTVPTQVSKEEAASTTMQDKALRAKQANPQKSVQTPMDIDSKETYLASRPTGVFYARQSPSNKRHRMVTSITGTVATDPSALEKKKKKLGV